MDTKKQDQFLKALSKRISDTRKAKGLTQEKFAELTELDRVAIANIETGRRRPTVTTVYKLCLAMNVKLQDLFKGL